MAARHPVSFAFASALLAILTCHPIASAQEITTEPLPGTEDGSILPGDPQDQGNPLGEGELEDGELDEEDEEDQGPVDVYTVTDIPVDVSAATTSAAREAAFSEGQRAGLVTLGEQLGLPAFGLTVERLSDDDIGQLVRSFSVANERTLPGRYIADMTFVYEPQAIRSLLRDGRVPAQQFVDNDRVVIIPVFDAGDGSGPRLWDPPNPWFDAWLNFDPDSVETEILVPYGDLLDVSDLSVDAAVATETPAIASLIERYGAGRGVIAIARPDGQSLTVSLSATSTTSLQAIDTVVAPLGFGLNRAATMGDAVQQVAERIDTSLFLAAAPISQPAALPAGGNASSLTVAVPIDAPADWYRVIQTLGQLPIVVGETVVSLAPREAIVRIEHLGSEEQLRTALAEQALVLQTAGGVKELRSVLP